VTPPSVVFQTPPSAEPRLSLCPGGAVDALHLRNGFHAGACGNLVEGIGALAIKPFDAGCLALIVIHVALLGDRSGAESAEQQAEGFPVHCTHTVTPLLAIFPAMMNSGT
jgi:hypothetical protein